MWGSGLIFAQPNGDKLFLEPRKDLLLDLLNLPQPQGLHPIFTGALMTATVVCDVWDRSYASGDCDEDDTFSLV